MQIDSIHHFHTDAPHMKLILIVFAIVLAVPTYAQTAGDEEAVALLEEAAKYSNLATSSSGSQRSEYIRKAAVAANLACNYADSASLKSQACDVAQRYSNIVTFD
jgi:hypothetical protein